MTPRRKAITLVALAALAALAACSPARRRTPDDTLVLAIETPMATYDPRYTLSNYDSKLAKLVAVGLTTVDTPRADAQLELASAIDQVDDVTVDVTVRADARFSDGSPVTADDVVRTYASVLDAACGSLYRKGFVERYRSIEARGDKVVRFHLAQPEGMFRADIEFGVISFHGVPAGECHPAVIGAGPYVVRELTSRHVTLDANPYYRAPARTPHVEIRFVPDDSARILMLVGGSIDLVQNAVRPDLVDDVRERPRVVVHAAPSVILTYVLLNNEDEHLRDVRVRQAIALAIDRKAIVAAEFGGRAVLATGLLPPSHWAYSADVARWDFDPARARALLDAAGLRPGRDGVRLRLVYKTSAVDFRIAVARLIASQLGEVGIAVEVQPFEFATFFADIKKGNYQIATMQSSEITEPDFHHFYFHSSHIPDAKTDPDGGNRWRYRNAEMDEVTLAGRRETDPERRRPIYARAQQIVASDLPIIPLWHEDNVVLSNVDVQGYEIVPNARLVGLAAAAKTP